MTLLGSRKLGFYEDKMMRARPSERRDVCADGTETPVKRPVYRDRGVHTKRTAPDGPGKRNGGGSP